MATNRTLERTLPLACRLRRGNAFWFAAFLGVAAILVHPAAVTAQQPAPPYSAGDAAVTGFSGALPPVQIAPGVDPDQKTFIDPNGPSLRVVDLHHMGGPAQAQLVLSGARFQLGSQTLAFSTTIPRGQLISWTGEGSQLTQGSTVDVVVSNGPPTIAVPSVASLTRSPWYLPFLMTAMPTLSMRSGANSLAIETWRTFWPATWIKPSPSAFWNNLRQGSEANNRPRRSIFL